MLVALGGAAATCGSPAENAGVTATFSNLSLVASTAAPWNTTLTFTLHFQNGRAGVAPATTVNVRSADVFLTGDGADQFVASFAPIGSPSWSGMLASGEQRDENYTATSTLSSDPSTNLCGQAVRALVTVTT